MKVHKNVYYVLPNDFRLLAYWFVPISAVILVLFSLAFLKVVIWDQREIIPNLISAIIFGLVCLLLIRFNQNTLPVVNLSFSFASNLITNQYGNVIHSVNIDQALFLSEVQLAFAVRGMWVESFFILSNQPFSQEINIEMNGVYTLTKLAKNQIVILPSSEDTYIWITNKVGNIHIPQYPRVAYLHQKKY